MTYIHPELRLPSLHRTWTCIPCSSLTREEKESIASNGTRLGSRLSFRLHPWREAGRKAEGRRSAYSVWRTGLVTGLRWTYTGTNLETADWAKEHLWDQSL